MCPKQQGRQEIILEPDPIVHYATNENLKNKPDCSVPYGHPEWLNMSESWINRIKPLSALMRNIVHEGHPTAPHLLSPTGAYYLDEPLGYRKDDNFVCADLVFLDIDGTMNIEEVTGHPVYGKYGTAYYTTCSHREDNPRIRVIFRLETPVTSVPDLKNILRVLIPLFKSDQACSDAARIMFGNSNAEYEINPERYIDDIGKQYLIELGQKMISTSYTPSPACKSSSNELQNIVLDKLIEVGIDSYTDLRYMFPAMILEGFTEEDCLRILWPRISRYGVNKVRKLITENYRRYTIEYSHGNMGTLINYIRRNGHPDFLKSQSRIVEDKLDALKRKINILELEV